MNDNTGHPKYVYHYCAKWTIEGGRTCTVSGMAQMVNKIESMDGYDDLKVLIDADNASEMLIVSLSIIGELDD